jgi:putative sigma-54 modulation protein
MRFIISGKNLNVTDGLRTAIYEKFGKLERYFTPETEIHVTLSVEKNRHTIEVTIPMKGTIIRAEQTTDDMYTSIDAVEDVIERQLRKYKNKLVSHKQAAKNFKPSFLDVSQDSVEPEESDEIKIVRTKRFEMKPMFPEEACVQMELLGHNFFVFTSAETGDVNVVYKRNKKNTYGLIEPEF